MRVHAPGLTGYLPSRAEAPHGRRPPVPQEFPGPAAAQVSGPPADAVTAGSPALHVAHLNARDATLVYVSRAPQPDIARVKARMGWTMPWYTMTDGFDTDFGVDEWHGTNAFIRDGDTVFRTYFINNRGDEAMGSTWSYLDLTALGRQEDWEDSPEGYPQTPPYTWWNWHDEYGDAT